MSVSPEVSAEHDELAALRAFVASMLAAQQRLHADLARLRGSVAERDGLLLRLREERDAAREAAAISAERKAHLDAARRETADAEARLADLQARHARLLAAVAELRERSRQR